MSNETLCQKLCVFNLDSRPPNQRLLCSCTWFQTVIFSSLQDNYCRNRGVMKERIVAFQLKAKQLRNGERNYLANRQSRIQSWNLCA